MTNVSRYAELAEITEIRPNPPVFHCVDEYNVAVTTTTECIVIQCVSV